MKGNSKSYTFQTDLRISFNYEHKLDESCLKEPGIKQTKIRVKKRHTFIIGWTRIDLTEVDNCDQSGPVNEKQYEVEMEIQDIDHIKSFALNNDHINLKKKVRKFILNQICISSMVMNEVVKVKKTTKP